MIDIFDHCFYFSSFFGAMKVVAIYLLVKYIIYTLWISKLGKISLISGITAKIIECVVQLTEHRFFKLDRKNRQPSCEPKPQKIEECINMSHFSFLLFGKTLLLVKTAEFFYDLVEKYLFSLPCWVKVAGCQGFLFTSFFIGGAIYLFVPGLYLYGDILAVTHALWSMIGWFSLPTLLLLILACKKKKLTIFLMYMINNTVIMMLILSDRMKLSIAIIISCFYGVVVGILKKSYLSKVRVKFTKLRK